MAKAPTKKPAEDEPTSDYVALGLIEHDGEVYEPGDTLKLTDRQAEALLAVKAVKAADAPAEPAKTE